MANNKLRLLSLPFFLHSRFSIYPDCTLLVLRVIDSSLPGRQADGSAFMIGVGYFAF